jgi:cell division transport system ATP-binding protein
MIQFKHVTKIFPPDKIALDDVSFKVGGGEFVSLVGKSGAGKTTLFKLLLAERGPTKGRVFFEGQDVHKIRRGKLYQLRRKLGVVFQDYKLLSSKTAYENVAYVMKVIGASDSAIKREVPQVLEIVGLEDKAQNLPEELSGGEKQRVAIARALVHRPKAILADEPTGNLDPYHAAEIIQLLLKIHELGTTVLLATHNKGIIDSLGRRVITLEEGRVVRDDQKGRFIL